MSDSQGTPSASLGDLDAEAQALVEDATKALDSVKTMVKIAEEAKVLNEGGKKDMEVKEKGEEETGSEGKEIEVRKEKEEEKEKKEEKEEEEEENKKMEESGKEKEEAEKKGEKEGEVEGNVDRTYLKTHGLSMFLSVFILICVVPNPLWLVSNIFIALINAFYLVY